MLQNHFNSMKEKINAYFAVLLITIFGAGAASIIVRVANTDTMTSMYAYDGTYTPPVHE